MYLYTVEKVYVWLPDVLCEHLLDTINKVCRFSILAPNSSVSEPESLAISQELRVLLLAYSFPILYLVIHPQNSRLDVGR